MIESVGFYAGEDTKVPAEDQKKLVDFFNQQLNIQLAKKFPTVEEAGPAVMKRQVAMTDVSSATLKIVPVSGKRKAKRQPSIQYVTANINWKF